MVGIYTVVIWGLILWAICWYVVMRSRRQAAIHSLAAQLDTVLAISGSVNTAAEYAAHQIANTLGVAKVGVYFRGSAENYAVGGTIGHPRIAPRDLEWLEKRLLSTELQRTVSLPPHSQLCRLLRSHSITALLPLIQNNQTIGFVAVNAGGASQDYAALVANAHKLTTVLSYQATLSELRAANARLSQQRDLIKGKMHANELRVHRLDATKDEFISMASHQLRTPLTSIKGYVSMVLEGDAGAITPDQRHLLQEAFTSSERMVHLIHDFLNVSRLQNGKFMLDTHPCDIVALVKSEVASLQASAKNRQLKLVCKTKLRRTMLSIDETKIRQVVMNFIDNALYYSRPKSTITVTLEMKGAAIELRVIDTGIGVPKSEQRQLFSKFFRATNARKQRPDGTGVGLYLAKKVVDAHKGKIIFKSAEGAGSTFGFVLPIAD